MVRSLLLFLFMPFLLSAAEVQVDAKVNAYDLKADSPIQVTISITHPSSLQINADSFQLENESIKPSLIKSLVLSKNPSIELTLYQIELHGKPEGLYFLPEVNVKVGDKIYRSIASSYEITQGGRIPSNEKTYAPEKRSQPQAASLNLQYSVKAKDPLYPGEKAIFTYFIYYSGNVQLTQSYFPLLEAKGFKKVGEKQVKDYTKDGVSVQEISQEVEALTPGDYQYSPSFVEGVGNQKKLYSDTSSVVVTVAPFPANKPNLFKGAVGKFTIKSTLLTPQEVFVDDKMTLDIEIMGSDLNTVTAPNLKLPEFTRNFRFSDLPTTGEVIDNKKHFKFDLYPNSLNVKEIPSIPFSYFDIEKSKYITLYTDPISISVHKENKEQEPKKEELPQQEIVSNYAIGPIDIKGMMPLTLKDIGSLPFGTWNVFYLIPLALLFLFSQYKFKEWLEKKKQLKPVYKSHILFQEWLQLKESSPLFYQKLQDAFLHLLVEAGEIPSLDIAIENLKETAVTKDVKALFQTLQERRFTGKEVDVQLLEKIKKLFKEIEERK